MAIFKQTTRCILLLVVVLSSCGSYKNIPYYQDLNHDIITEETVSNFSPLTIHAGDILGINVTSRNPESSAKFNTGSSQENAVEGYLVDDKGEIQLPYLGMVKVTGLTTAQLRDTLSGLLLTFYKNPVVNIRLLNFKVAVSGDVQRPDVYRLQNERTTITQILSLAGDLNITAMRKNVILIREENGKRSFIPIDLTSKKIFDSPYYYLKNNDEIYVQPDRTKYATVDRGYRTASLILSGLSVIAIVLSTLYR
jgi:polysaccharide export outer membrane protein